MTPRPRGNPVRRLRGQVVRAVIGATVKPDAPVPLEELMGLVRASRREVLRQLARMQAEGRLRGYTTRGGVVQVW